MPQGEGEPRPVAGSDVAAILARIDDILGEIRELRRTPPVPGRPPPLEEAELSSVQERALQVLAERGEMTSLEVAEALNRTRPLMVINLNHLVALGLVEKVRRGRQVYFRRRLPEPSAVIGEGLEESGCYIFAVLACDSWPEDMEDVERLIYEHLKDIPNWRVDHVALLPRPAAERRSSEPYGSSEAAKTRR